MKNTSLSLLLLLTITACKSINGQLWEHKAIESDMVVDTTTTDTTITVLMLVRLIVHLIVRVQVATRPRSMTMPRRKPPMN